MAEIQVSNIPDDVTAAVSSAAGSLGLTITLTASLASYPGSTHWHLRKGSRPGTLEVTWWPSAGRLWVCCHANRVGDGWVERAAVPFAEALSKAASP